MVTNSELAIASRPGKQAELHGLIWQTTILPSRTITCRIAAWFQAAHVSIELWCLDMSPDIIWNWGALENVCCVVKSGEASLRKEKSYTKWATVCSADCLCIKLAALAKWSLELTFKCQIQNSNSNYNDQSFWSMSDQPGNLQGLTGYKVTTSGYSGMRQCMQGWLRSKIGWIWWSFRSQEHISTERIGILQSLKKVRRPSITVGAPICLPVTSPSLSRNLYRPRRMRGASLKYHFSMWNWLQSTRAHMHTPDR